MGKKGNTSLKDPKSAVKWAGKAKREAAIYRMRRLIAAQTGAPVIDFQRFNVAGLEFKGQKVSGFGEVGLGATIGVGINIGNLICPGVIRASLDGNVGASGAARAMLLVQRDPQFTMTQRLTAAREKGTWMNPAPVSMHVLEGGAAAFEATAGAQISAGIGNPFDVDENGIAIGAKVSVTTTHQFISLSTDHPQFYVSAQANNLCDEFDAIVNHKIKKAVAPFIAHYKASGLTKSFLEFVGAIPEGPVDPRSEQLLKAARVAGIKERLDEWDLSWSTNFASIIKGGIKYKQTSFLKTKDIETDLKKIQGDLKTLLNRLVPETLYALYYGGEEKNGTVVPLSEDDAKNVYQLIEVYERNLAISESVDAAIEILERRSSGKKFGSPTKATLDTKKPLAGIAPSILDAHVSRIEGMAGVAGHATISVDGAFGAGLSTSAVLDGAIEVACFGWETACKGFFPDDGTARNIVIREQTALSKKFLKFEAGALAKAHGSDASKSSEKKGLKHRHDFYGTMSYESVRVCRYETEFRALPNGSGVIVGISVLAKRLKAYVEFCKNGTESDAARKLEKLLVKRFMVGEPVLQRFFRDAVLDWLEDDIGVLVEAAYEFVDERQPFEEKDYENLLEAVRRIAAENPGTSRLQVLRLRHRQENSAIKRRLVFGLGWASDLVGGGTSGRYELGGAVFRTYAAGVENTLDFHVKYYGPNAKALESMTGRYAYEYSIAPATLFNF